MSPATKDHSGLITVAAVGGGALATHLAINAIIEQQVAKKKDDFIDDMADAIKGPAEQMENFFKEYLTFTSGDSKYKKNTQTVNTYLDGVAQLAKEVPIIPAFFFKRARIYARKTHVGKIAATIAAGAALAGTFAHLIQKKKSGK